MLREARITRLGQRVEKITEVQAVSDPLAAAAAAASLYAENKTTPQDVLDYFELLAKAASRINEDLDEPELRARLCVLVGSSLLKFGSDVLWRFLDPRRAGLTVKARLSQ